ncbi:MAG: ribbon-helix-helix domain-containing protein [Sphaerochaeta sp.]|jgi:hypothetical protein|nr:ribbon-helix-helix domain-containing protein [Sphaerochaeta sp.]
MPNNLYRFLRDWNEVSVSEHIRRAIEEYVEKLKKQVRISGSASKTGGENGR